MDLHYGMLGSLFRSGEYQLDWYIGTVNLCGVSLIYVQEYLQKIRSQF